LFLLRCIIKEKKVNQNVRFIGQSPGPLSNWDQVKSLENESILFLDVAPYLDLYHQLIKQKNKVFVIDHHLSNIEKELVTVPEDQKYLDINYSAAYLTWKYFFEEEELVPYCIELIHFRDLWKRVNNDNMHYLFCCINNTPKDQIVDLLIQFCQDESMMREILVKTYKPIWDYLVAEYLRFCRSHSSLLLQKIQGIWYMVASINFSQDVSLMGDLLLKEYPCDFAQSWIYSEEKDYTYISLRSLKTKSNTAAIASPFHGGGHYEASGVRMIHQLKSSLASPDCTFVLDKNKTIALFTQINDHQRKIYESILNTLEGESRNSFVEEIEPLVGSRFFFSRLKELNRPVPVNTSLFQLESNDYFLYLKNQSEAFSCLKEYLMDWVYFGIQS